jgi:hypothetical protein
MGSTGACRNRGLGVRRGARPALYIGGGNSSKVDIDLPPNVKRVDNSAGLLGGVKLWDRDSRLLMSPRLRDKADVSEAPGTRSRLGHDSAT